MTRRATVAAAVGLAVLGAAATAWATEQTQSFDWNWANHVLRNLPAPGSDGTRPARLQDVAPGACIPKSSGANTLPFICSVPETDYITPAYPFGGQLGGTPAAATVLGIRETGGPTLLTIGAIANGALTKRLGSTFIGATPGIDFLAPLIVAAGNYDRVSVSASGLVTGGAAMVVANVTALEALTGANYRDGSSVYVSSVAADFVLHTTSSVTVDHITIASVSGSSGARWIRRPTPDGYWYQTGTQFYLGGAGASDENNCTAAITPCATAGELRRRLKGRIMPAGATQSFTINIDSTFAGGDFDPITAEIDPTRNAGTVVTFLGTPAVTAIGTVASAVAHNYAGNQLVEIVVSGYDWSTKVGKIIRKVGTTGTSSVTSVVVADLGGGRARIMPSNLNTISVADLTTGDVVEELTTLPRVMGARGLGFGATFASMINFDPTGTSTSFETNQGNSMFIIGSYVKGATAGGGSDTSGRGIGFYGCSVSRAQNFRGSFAASRSAFFSANINVANSVVGRNEWQDSVLVNSTLSLSEYMHTRFHSLGVYGLGAGAAAITLADGASVTFTDAIYGTGNNASSTIFSFITRGAVQLAGGTPVTTSGSVATVPTASVTITTADLPYYEDIYGNSIFGQQNVDPYKKMTAFTNGGVSSTQVMFANSTKTIAGSSNFVYADGTPSTIARMTIGDHVNSIAGRITLDTIDAGVTSSAAGLLLAQGGTNFLTVSAIRNSTATTGKVTAAVSITPVSGGSQQDSFSIAGNTNPAGSIVVYPHTNYGDVVLGGNNGGDEMPSTATTGWVWIPRVNGAPTNTPTLDGVTSGPRARQAIGYDRLNKRLYLYDSLTSAWRYAEFNNGVVPYAQITGAPAAITATTGDVVANGPGSVPATIQAGVVTNAKLANMTAPAFKGRITAGSGPPEDLTATQATSMLNQFTASLQGLVPASGGGSTNVLHADGTWSSAGGGGTVTSVGATDPATSTGGTTPSIGVKFDNVTVLLNGGGGLTRAAIGGDGTIALGSNTFALTNIPTGTTMAGSLLATAIAAPGTPAAGKGSAYVDSTSKNIALKADDGTVKHGVQTKAAVTSNFVTAISDAGVVSVAQPAATDITGLAAIATSGSATDLIAGTLPAGRFPALTGDITAPGGSLATTLKNTGAGAGSCTYCSVTFDAQGRETTYSSGATPEVPLTFSTGLTRTVNTVTANISTGVSGGQTIIGGTASGNSLTISSTSNAAKGKDIFGTTSKMFFDESTVQLAVGAGSGTMDSGSTAQFTNNLDGIARAYVSNNSSGGSAFSGFVAGQNQNNAFTDPEVAMYMSGPLNGGVYGANSGIFELYGGSVVGGNGNMVFSIVESSGGYLWKTGLTPATKMSLTNAGVLTVNGLGTGLVKTTSGAFANASASDIAAAQVWPAAPELLISTGASSAPGGVAGLNYDSTGNGFLELSDDIGIAQYNSGAGSVGNYERVTATWNSGQWLVETEAHGTGVLNNLSMRFVAHQVDLCNGSCASFFSVQPTGQLLQQSNKAVTSAAAAVADSITLTPAVTVSGSTAITTNPFSGVTIASFGINSAANVNVAVGLDVSAPQITGGGAITTSWAILSRGTLRVAPGGGNPILDVPGDATAGVDTTIDGRIMINIPGVGTKYIRYYND